MQAKPGVIERLNNILTIELTAVNQYFLQAEMCRNWGYERLYEKLRDLSMGEMKDAQEMVRYILFLEGVPNLQRLNDVRVGESVLEHLQLNVDSELNILNVLTEAISHCQGVEDYATRGMLEMMARDEQEHVDWLETQLESIRQIGIENYLSQQLYD
jgi:bacterioferritin